MDDKFLHLIANKDGIVESFSIFEPKDKQYIKVLAESHESLLEIYNLLEQELNLGNKKYVLLQDSNGLYFLKQLYYIYYDEDGKAISIGPTLLTDFDSDNTIKCRFVIIDEIVEDVINGKLNLNQLQVTADRKKSSIVRLIKKEDPKSVLWKPNSINKYKMTFDGKDDSPLVAFDKRKKEIYIKHLKKLPEVYLWAFFTAKNDPTIVLTQAMIKVIENNTIMFFGLPDWLEEFDLYSNITSKDGFRYEIIS